MKIKGHRLKLEVVMDSLHIDTKHGPTKDYKQAIKNLKLVRAIIEDYEHSLRWCDHAINNGNRLLLDETIRAIINRYVAGDKTTCEDKRRLSTRKIIKHQGHGKYKMTKLGKAVVSELKNYVEYVG